MKYTPRSERVLQHAEHIAEEHGHDYVGTEHLLLELLDEPAGSRDGYWRDWALITTQRASPRKSWRPPQYSKC